MKDINKSYDVLWHFSIYPIKYHYNYVDKNLIILNVL